MLARADQGLQWTAWEYRSSPPLSHRPGLAATCLLCCSLQQGKPRKFDCSRLGIDVFLVPRPASSRDTTPALLHVGILTVDAEECHIDQIFKQNSRSGTARQRGNAL